MNMRDRVLRSLSTTSVLLLIAACVTIVSKGASSDLPGRRRASIPVANHHPQAAATSSTRTPITTPTPRSASSHPRSPARDARAALARMLAALPQGSASVAALNLNTGAHYRGGASGGQWMASVYKLLVLHLLWLRQRGFVSDAERSDAVAAIENSDNAAGYRLFLDLGGNSAIRDGAARLHLARTVPGISDPTFTTTGAADCVALLRSVLKDPYALSLMRDVESDQRWGVGAVPGARNVAVKNGWLSVDDGNGPGENDGGRWIANSIGIVTVHGQRLLLAVLTQHNADLDAGIALVERLARQAAAAVTS